MVVQLGYRPHTIYNYKDLNRSLREETQFYGLLKNPRKLSLRARFEMSTPGVIDSMSGANPVTQDEEIFDPAV